MIPVRIACGLLHRSREPMLVIVTSAWVHTRVVLESAQHSCLNHTQFFAVGPELIHYLWVQIALQR